MESLTTKAGLSAEPIVHVIDDDKEIRESLLDLFMITNRRASAYSSGPDFLKTVDTTAPGCVVVDLRMPEGSGLDVQSELITMGSRMP